MNTTTKWTIVRIVFTSLYLFFGWLLFTWSLHSRSLLLGAAFSLLIAVTTFKIFIDDDEAARRSLLPRPDFLLLYLLYLIFSVYWASCKTAYYTLRNDFNPRVVHFRTRLNSDIARSLIGASITLTPGTICLGLSEDHLVIHWLTAKTTHSRYAGTLVKGGFERFLRRIWV
jgi:multicomponent Na+:H+ antiporter subunit E